MGALATYLGCEWNRRHTCIRCPNKNGHDKGDRHPSGKVYPDHIYCYSCRVYYGVVDLVMAVLNISFQDAVNWFAQNMDNLGQTLAPKEVKESTPYQGPVPREIVEYWHNCLSADTRKYLHNRLLTDETIDTLRIGWRPDWKAYTIPFWRGEPGESEIDILQYRLTEGESRYIGMTGHNRSSIINPHRIGLHSVVMLFGTFDAILASQDGISAISSNGATAFTRSDEDLARLRRLLGKCKVYLVPDQSNSEMKPAYILAGRLNAEVRHFSFPEGSKDKDYTDFRVAGGTPEEFIREVLMIRDGFVKAEHDEWFTEMLKSMCDGDWNRVDQLLFALQREYPNYMIVNQHIQQRIAFDPFLGIKHEQWDILRHEMEYCNSYEKIYAWAQKACEWAHRNKGGF